MVMTFFLHLMKLSRRTALLAGSSLGVSTLSGCARLPFVGPRLSLTLLNFDSARHVLNVELLRAEGRERSESVVLQEGFELQAPSEGDTVYDVHRPDIVESRKYVVRAYLRDNQATRARYHFYPDCTGNDEPDEKLYIEIHREDSNSQPHITFKQNVCGSDTWWF